MVAAVITSRPLASIVDTGQPADSIFGTWTDDAGKGAYPLASPIVSAH